MPKVGMHKHVRKELEGLEVRALDIVEGKPFVEWRKNEIGHYKNSYIYQQQILNDWSNISKHII